MKKSKNKYVGGVVAMSLLACTNFVYAGTAEAQVTPISTKDINNLSMNVAMPQVTLHHKQVANNKVNIDLGITNLSDEVIALEVSFVAEDIQSVLAATSGVNHAYTTHKLQTLSDGTEKLTLYIVSTDAEMPLVFTQNQGKLTLSSLSLQTSGQLTLDTDKVSVKLIEKGYRTTEYNNVTLLYTETDYTPDEAPEEKPEEKPEQKPEEDTDSGSSGNGGNNNMTDEDYAEDYEESLGGNNGNGNNNVNNENNENNASNEADQNTGDVATDTDESIAASFTDVNNHWAKSAITNMASKGIIKGYADGSFKPNASITRGEFATLLARAFELEKISEVNPFTDVIADKWYTDGIVALYHGGITSGRGDGTFGVNDQITNEEISAMLYRTINVLQMQLEEINPEGITFTDDAQISSYAKEAVSALVKMGILSGKPDGSFAPKASTSRAQVAVMLDRVFNLASQ